MGTMKATHIPWSSGLSLNDNQIEHVTYLGITIDQNLIFNIVLHTSTTVVLYGEQPVTLTSR